MLYESGLKMGQNDRINRTTRTTRTHTGAYTYEHTHTHTHVCTHARMNLTKQHIKAKFVYKN